MNTTIKLTKVLSGWYIYNGAKSGIHAVAIQNDLGLWNLEIEKAGEVLENAIVENLKSVRNFIAAAVAA